MKWFNEGQLRISKNETSHFWPYLITLQSKNMFIWGLWIKTSQFSNNMFGQFGFTHFIVKSIWLLHMQTSDQKIPELPDLTAWIFIKIYLLESPSCPYLIWFQVMANRNWVRNQIFFQCTYYSFFRKSRG